MAERINVVEKDFDANEGTYSHTEGCFIRTGLVKDLDLDFDRV